MNYWEETRREGMVEKKIAGNNQNRTARIAPEGLSIVDFTLVYFVTSFLLNAFLICFLILHANTLVFL